ncbi:MAG: NUDIX domain-containing protein, partial [Thermomicrobium sp.]
GLAAFTVTLLFAGDHCLLLERGANRTRLPGFWTGIGGRVEPHEMTRLAQAARRELAEETGLPLDTLPTVILRRVLLQHRPTSVELTLLLYFTGELPAPIPLPRGPEGVFHWVNTSTLQTLPLADNARLVLPYLVTDQARDPQGIEPVKLGIARCDASGRVVDVLWG